MASGLLGFYLAKGDKYPTVPPEFAEHVGWLCFGLVAVMLVYAWTRTESVRRGLLALEDPRTWAVLRIGFAIFTLICFLNLYPYWRMLWSDEGIFDLAYARDRLGRGALRGWTPEDGFFDLWAIACFLWNKPSLFYVYGHPDFVVGYMVVFFLVLLLYACGVFSRVTGVIAWLMMSGVYNRNALYWEGTDTAYRCFWWILLFAKTGHAWSFDNWWRCRRLRKRGKMEGRPVYRLVPAWPRYLWMLQLAALYITTGAVKTGQVWADGDALYYALNMDHFYRFEYATQVVSSVFATNLFRLMTVVTHWWERLFPFVLLGVALRFSASNADTPWYKAQNTFARRWASRILLIGAYGLVYRIVVLTVPFCLAMRDDVPQDPTETLRKVHVAFGVVVPVLTVAWFALRRWPLTLFRGGRSLGRLTKRFAWLKLPEINITHDGLRGWLVGRRLWLTLGFMFHGFLIAFMNIGMFAPIVLMTYAGFLTGEEWARILKGIIGVARRQRRLKRWLPDSVDRFFVDAQSPLDVPVRGRRIPNLIILVFGLAGLGLAYGKVEKVEWISTAFYAWLGTILAVAVVFRLLRARPMDVARAREAGPALAYTSIGRALALGAVVYHASAVGLHLFPAYSVFSKWRGSARGLFAGWLKGAGATQSWRMFSPNPPRSNTFMKTVVVTEGGERWDLKQNAWEHRPNPWIINDRMRKMQRRMVGKGKWYLRYWASYHCREWALERDGVPIEIDIKKLVTHIPRPEVVNLWQPAKFKGRKDNRTGATTGQPYNPRKLSVREIDVQTHKCTGDGLVPEHIKRRYGLEVTEDDLARAQKAADRDERKFNNRRDTWDKRRDWGRWWSHKEDKAKRKADAEERRKRAAQARAQRDAGADAKAEERPDEGDGEKD